MNTKQNSDVSAVHARMKNPAFVLPDAMKGIGSIFKAVNAAGLSHELQEIVALRVSQINGCSACVFSHNQNLRKAGVSEDRVAAVAAWREAPFFDEAERAALNLAELATRLSDRSADAVVYVPEHAEGGRTGEPQAGRQHHTAGRPVLPGQR